MSERLTPEREAEIVAVVAELDADRTLSFGTWTASPVTEKSTLPPEQAFAVEDVAKLAGATLRGSVGVFGDERHARFAAMARTAVPALLAELAAVRAERDEARARVAELETPRRKRPNTKDEFGPEGGRVACQDCEWKSEWFDTDRQYGAFRSASLFHQCEAEAAR